MEISWERFRKTLKLLIFSEMRTIRPKSREILGEKQNRIYGKFRPNRNGDGQWGPVKAFVDYASKTGI